MLLQEKKLNIKKRETNMKAESITAIGEMLKQRKEIACSGYKNFRCNLEQKYHTEWLDDVIADTERVILNGKKKEYDSLCKLYEDFENHQW